MKTSKCTACELADLCEGFDDERPASCEEYDDFLARRCKETGSLFVNVYLDDRAYGGGEEGGWWFDCGEILEVYPVTSMRTAKRLVKRLEEGSYSNEGRPSKQSVISRGEFAVRIETGPGQSYPEELPGYC